MTQFDENDPDPELPDPSDMDSDDDSPLGDPCPNCGRAIFDDAEQCPHCGNYITREEPGPPKPPWILISVAVCLAIIALIWIYHM